MMDKVLAGYSCGGSSDWVPEGTARNSLFTDIAAGTGGVGRRIDAGERFRKCGKSGV